jgi:hypothetical protein
MSNAAARRRRIQRSARFQSTSAGPFLNVRLKVAHGTHWQTQRLSSDAPVGRVE